MRIGFNKISYSNRSFCARLSSPRNLGGHADIFLNTQKRKPFKYLTLETFQKLREADFIQSGTGPKGSYPTFVLEKSTGKPVEVFIKNNSDEKYLPNTIESYTVLMKDRNSQDYIDIGMRTFDLGDKKVIGSGYMQSFCNDKYEGIGIRAQQATVERMLETERHNVEITALFEAYPFHKGCGFDSYSKDFFMVKNFDDTLGRLIKKTKLEKNELMKLLEVCYKDLAWRVDMSKTKKNIAEYMLTKGKNLPDNDDVVMRLTRESKKEWEQFINEQPIMLNKKPL